MGTDTVNAIQAKHWDKLRQTPTIVIIDELVYAQTKRALLKVLHHGQHVRAGEKLRLRIVGKVVYNRIFESHSNE